MYLKCQRMVILFSGWVLIVLASLTLLNVFNADLWQNDGIYGTVRGVPVYNYQVYYFILCFIGFLIIAETTGPFMSRPRWKTRVNVLTIVGLVLFALVAFIKISTIIAPGLLE